MPSRRAVLLPLSAGHAERAIVQRSLSGSEITGDVVISCNAGIGESRISTSMPFDHATPIAGLRDRAGRWADRQLAERLRLHRPQALDAAVFNSADIP